MKNKAFRTIATVSALAFGSLLVSGCATTNPKDPLEPVNRVVFRFNDTVDRVALKPVATAYTKLPSFVQRGVGNFFGNLADLPTGVNNLLQGKIEYGMSDLMRFTFNSTFGLGGLLDIATEAGLTKHSEDFGQTLGKWGVPSGPYVVLPFLGSSTLRDTAALPVDTRADPWHEVHPDGPRNWGYGARVVDQRAALLDASTLIEEAALDRYQFVRDAYLQRRQSRINDGESPRTSYDDEPYEPMAEQEGSPATEGSSATVAQPAEKTQVPAQEPVNGAVVKEELNTAKATQPAPVEKGIKQ